jgi:hypothetical protein
LHAAEFGSLVAIVNHRNDGRGCRLAAISLRWKRHAHREKP